MPSVSATAIGAFVVGALALVSAAAVFFGGSMFGTNNEMRAASVIFTGSVKGLNIGAPVTLRGVKIGEVSDIGISYDSKTQEFVIPVIVAVNSHDLGMGEQPSESEFLEPLVARGLRAQLKTQSLLTGLLYVNQDIMDTHDIINSTLRPLNTLGEADLCPGNAALQKINGGFR